MKIAALDLGSNTFLCLIAEVSDGKIQRIISDNVEMVRLGEGVAQSRQFSSASLERADRALEHFSQLIAQHCPSQLAAVATAAARSVTNPEALVSLCQKWNIPLRIIEGDEEARMTYLGGLSGFNELNSDFMMIDIGGGSTEFIHGSGLKIMNKISLPIGAVKVSEAARVSTEAPLSLEQIQKIKAIIATELSRLSAHGIRASALNAQVKAVGLAGTAAEIGRLEGFRRTGHLEYDANRIDGVELDEKAFHFWEEELGTLSPRQVSEKYKVHAKRADVLLAGLMILSAARELLGLKSWTVSTRGIRFGLALELAGRAP